MNSNILKMLNFDHTAMRLKWKLSLLENYY